MICVTVLSTTLILGLVAGNPVSSFGYHNWVPMSFSDDEYVCRVIETKFADYPQIGQILDGTKEQLSDGAEYLFLFYTPHNRKCCGLLIDEYQVTYRHRCHPDIVQCRSDYFDDINGDKKQ